MQHTSRIIPSLLEQDLCKSHLAEVDGRLVDSVPEIASASIAQLSIFSSRIDSLSSTGCIGTTEYDYYFLSVLITIILIITSPD